MTRWKFVILITLTAIFIPVLAASAISTAKEKSAPLPSPSVTRQFTTDGSFMDGTRILVTVVASSSEEGAANSAISSALSRARTLESALFSEGGVDSQIANLKTGQPLTLTADVFDFISKSVDLSAYTNGWYDVAAPSDKGIFTRRDWRRIVLDKDARTISLRSDGMRLDLKRIATGHYADLIVDELLRSGFSNAKVNVGQVQRIAGRDIFTPWNVAIDFGTGGEYAHRSNNYNLSSVASATVTAGGLGSSLIDARSRKPVAGTQVKSVTVLASDAATATAYALAAYTLGPKVGLRFIEAHPETQGIIVDNSGALFASKGFNATTVKPEPSAAETEAAVDRGPNDLKQKEREENSDN